MLKFDLIDYCADYEIVRAADRDRRSRLSPDVINVGFDTGGEGLRQLIKPSKLSVRAYFETVMLKVYSTVM